MAQVSFSCSELLSLFCPLFRKRIQQPREVAQIPEPMQVGFSSFPLPHILPALPHPPTPGWLREEAGRGQMSRGTLGRFVCSRTGGWPGLRSVGWVRIHRDKSMLSVDFLLQLRAQIRMQTGWANLGPLPWSEPWFQPC